jgi:peptide/nickel transport system substrate-binding protein
MNMPSSFRKKSPSFRSAAQDSRTADVTGTSAADALQRRSFLKLMLAGAGSLAWPFGLGHAQTKESVLRIGMTLSDIPVTTGQASGGAEGVRFLNRSVYDALLNWDLSRADRPSGLIPSLAESWSVDPKDRNLWTFKLRRGVKFHDGSTFTARDVVWNFDKLMKPNSPQYDRLQARNAANWLVSVKSAQAVDDYTLEIRTNAPNGTLLYEMVNICYSSPRQWEKLGRDWEKFAFEPSGTGPYKLVLLVPRSRAEFVRNTEYWNKNMIPQHDRMVLRPMPDANTRVAALLSGQVDLVEALPADAVPTVKAAGMQVTTNVYPHIWPYMISHLPDSPFRDIRIRKAANLAIDRENLAKLLGGLAMPARGFVTPDHPWFGKPTFEVKYHPDAARKLMAEAGYGRNKPLKVKFVMSTAGSGQMHPLPMNEFIQQNFRDVGIDVSLETLDWEALRSRRLAGAEAPINKGVDAINYSWSIQYPVFGIIGQTYHGKNRVSGYNWGHFADPKADELAKRSLEAFDIDEQNRRIAELHAYLVDQAVWVWVVHDMNPRGLASHVKGFVQAQSWFQDFTPIRIERG